MLLLLGKSGGPGNTSGKRKGEEGKEKGEDRRGKEPNGMEWNGMQNLLKVGEGGGGGRAGAGGELASIFCPAMCSCATVDLLGKENDLGWRAWLLSGVRKGGRMGPWSNVRFTPCSQLAGPAVVWLHAAPSYLCSEGLAPRLC